MNPRTAAWLAWSVWALSSTLTALSLLLLILSSSHPNTNIFDYWVESTLISVSCSTVGALIASRRPENPTGWLFCALGLAAGVRHFGAEYAIYALLAEPGSLPFGEMLAWITSWIRVPYFSLFVYVALVFPDGRLPPGRWRWVAWLTAIVVVVGTISVAFSRGATRGLGPIHNPFEIEWVPRVATLVELLIFALGILAGASLFARLRRATWVERQQIKWFAYSITVTASGAILTYSIGEALGVGWIRGMGFVFVIVGLVGISTSVGIAILRYRLYEIDHIINRTLVYGTLTTCVVLIYVLAVGGLGALFQARGHLGISLLATGLVAVLFQPLRSRLQRSVNRLMYGERDDPYAVTSRLGRRLEATLEPEGVLPTVVETIAQALKLPYVAILLKEGDRFNSAVTYGSPTGEPEALPLVYQREEIGRLVISPRAPGEEFSDADRRLLEDLARQAEVAVHAVRLTADLQSSRERLVATREEERRRLRRDLHDGLGPTVASLALKLDIARKLVRRKPEDAEDLLSQLKDQTQETVVEVSRLVYGLRPPALDDLGLVAAIRQQAEGHGFVVDGFSREIEKEASREDGLVSFSIEAPDDLPLLPAAVEVAAYRIAQEALTNVARHAHANTCGVRISVDRAGGALTLEVRDDGVGMPEGRRAGVGFSSMRERAEELGGRCEVEPDPEGGTRVLTRLPLPTSEKHPEGARSLWRAPSESS